MPATNPVVASPLYVYDPVPPFAVKLTEPVPPLHAICVAVALKVKTVGMEVLLTLAIYEHPIASVTVNEVSPAPTLKVPTPL